MAFTIGTAEEILLRIEYQDAKGKRAVKTYALSGSTTDNDLKAALVHLDLLTNATGIRASVLTSRPITGFKTPAVNEMQNTVKSEMLLTFTKTNPVDGTKVSTKEFTVPSYVDALEDTDGTPVVVALDDLAELITFLEANLTMRGGDGVFYPGNWTYQGSESGFFAAPGQE